MGLGGNPTKRFNTFSEGVFQKQKQSFSEAKIETKVGGEDITGQKRTPPSKRDLAILIKIHSRTGGGYRGTRGWV